MLERIYGLKERLAIRRLMFPSTDYTELMHGAIVWIVLLAIVLAGRAAYVILSQIPIRAHYYGRMSEPELSTWWTTSKQFVLIAFASASILTLLGAAVVHWRHGDALYDKYGIGRTRARLLATGFALAAAGTLFVTCLFW